MWTILKIDRKNRIFKRPKNKTRPNTIFYNPIIVQNMCNKLVNKELTLLGDYLFCFNADLKNPAIRSFKVY